MKPLLFLASILFLISCGGPEKKVEEEGKVTPEDTSSAIIDTSALVEAGDTIEMDSTMEQDEGGEETKKGEQTTTEIKVIPKHGSPDDEEIKKMKEEKNKKK